LTGYRGNTPIDPGYGRPVNFLNTYGCSGLFFQTGAWEKNHSSEVGIFWLTLRYIISVSSRNTLLQFLDEPVNGIFHGWSFGGGIDINGLVNIRIIYYKYVREPIPLSIPSFCQFSFHYTLK
jgi:hypothetical protein